MKKVETNGKPMTIAELYQWAKANGCENHSMVVGPLDDGYHWNVCKAEITKNPDALTDGYGYVEDSPEEVVHIGRMEW